MTGVSTSCGACKFLRRKCTSDCVFAPYFRYDLAPQHFAAVHKVFGASNASRLLLHLPEQCRSEAATAMSFEALARMQDPVYGCVSYIYALQQQVAELQEEVETLSKHVAANLAISIPSNELLQFPSPSTTIMDMQYTSLQQKWTETLESNSNWVFEDDINLLSQTAYCKEENFPGFFEPNPFETPFGAGIICEEMFNHLPLLPGNS